MARRLFSGRRFSENGWPYVDQGSCKWFQIAPGVSIQIQEGAPFALLGAFARDYHANVEPIFDPDSACWTEGNSVPSSNHPGGTACDIRWQSHPFQVRGTFTPAQIATLRDLLAFYEGMIYWGGDWNSPVDEMHWQVGYNTYDQVADAPFPKVFDFIARKIRADGYSTFKRGNAPMPNDIALILSQATGLDLNRATEILPAVRDGLVASECTNPNRIAMWLAQVGHESVSFKYTEEIAKNGRYAPYIGRTWIQITWDYNYRDFSKWCFDRQLVPSPDYFVVNYRELADLKWAGLGAAWYWTVARGTRINEAADRRDLVTATQLINGGQNGSADRTARYDRASALGDRLLGLLQDNIELDEWEALMASTELSASRSIYRTSDAKTMSARDALFGADASAHATWIEQKAFAGDPWAIGVIAALAAGQLPASTDPWAVDRARFILSTLEANNPAALTDYLASKGTA